MPSREVLNKFKSGTLHSGSKSGPVVKSRRQAIAILMSERQNEAEHGGVYRESPRMKKPTRRKG